MKLHSLFVHGIAAALVLGTASVASAQNAAETVQVAAANGQKSNVKGTAANKKAADSRSKAKAAKKAPKNAAAAEKPRSLLAIIFNPNRADAPASQQRKPVAQERNSAQKAKPAVAGSQTSAIVTTGNNGELRSESATSTRDPLFSSLFGGKARQPQSRLLPETRALDAALAARDARKQFKVRADFEPQAVRFGGYPRGTIVIDTSARYLYLVESSSTARRYAIAVGRDGLQFKGKATVGDKQEWPRWIPTLDMQKREPRKYGQYKDGMPGGPNNPLGARAIYLYQGNKDTHIRIHGTNQPQTIGTSSSNGCFRMVNEHVQDLYSRIGLGTQVIVM